MCYFTYKFYECKHRAEDHIVKCEKKKNDGSGTHCNPDQRGYKNLPECGIVIEDLNSLCKPCVARERKRRLDEAEAEAIKRDIERTRLLDLEEQRRKAAAHEAHMKKVQGESLAEWERQEADRLKQILKESMERQQQEQASHLSSVTEASRREHAAHMEEQYGEVVEDGSSRDYHHVESHQRTSSSTTANSSATNTPPPPAPPLPPASTSSGFSAKTIHSKASLRASSTAGSAAASASSPPPPPPLSPASASMHSTSGHSACLKEAVHSRSSTSSIAESMPRAPAPPKPAFPPMNYSQPPQDQNYGRFMIGTRHQPIHPTQEVSEAPTPPTKPPAPRAPAPAVRLAGSVTPAATLAPTGFQLGADDLQNRLRSSANVKRPAPRAPRSPVANEQPPNELEAIWNRLGIQREVDDDDDISTSSLTPSQSASQVSSRRSSDDWKDEGQAGNVRRP